MIRAVTKENSPQEEEIIRSTFRLHGIRENNGEGYNVADYRVYAGGGIYHDQTVDFDENASLSMGEGTIIEHGVKLSGGVNLGKNVRVKAHTQLENVTIGDGQVIEDHLKHAVLPSYLKETLKRGHGHSFNKGYSIYIQPDGSLGGVVHESVIFADKLTTWIDRDTIVDPMVEIASHVKIGKGGHIGEYAELHCGVILGDRNGIGQRAKVFNKVTTGDDVFISSQAEVGASSVLHRDVMIDRYGNLQPNCELRKGVRLQEYVKLGSHVFIEPGAQISSFVVIGDYARVEKSDNRSPDSMKPEKQIWIGRDAHIGAYARVQSSMEANQVVAPRTTFSGEFVSTAIPPSSRMKTGAGSPVASAASSIAAEQSLLSK